MGELISIAGKQFFTLEEARTIIPLIAGFTAQSSKEVDRLIRLLDHMRSTLTPVRIAEIENQIRSIILRWQEKVEKLGGNPQGLWVVDFDFGSGYFCWKYPEPDILHWHGYLDGFSQRQSINDNCLNDLSKIGK